MVDGVSLTQTGLDGVWNCQCQQMQPASGMTSCVGAWIALCLALSMFLQPSNWGSVYM